MGVMFLVNFGGIAFSECLITMWWKRVFKSLRGLDIKGYRKK